MDLEQREPTRARLNPLGVSDIGEKPEINFLIWESGSDFSDWEFFDSVVSGWSSPLSKVCPSEEWWWWWGRARAAVCSQQETGCWPFHRPLWPVTKKHPEVGPSYPPVSPWASGISEKQFLFFLPAPTPTLSLSWCSWLVLRVLHSTESESHSVLSTLCEPWTGCSLPGSSVHGILQARTLECVAIPFSGGIFLDPGIESSFPALKVISLPSEPPGKP